MAIDPVCGLELDEKRAEYKYHDEDQVYFFCSKDCKEEFLDCPEDFKLDELFTKEGKKPARHKKTRKRKTEMQPETTMKVRILTGQWNVIELELSPISKAEILRDGIAAIRLDDGSGRLMHFVAPNPFWLPNSAVEGPDEEDEPHSHDFSG